MTWKLVLTNNDNHYHFDFFFYGTLIFSKIYYPGFISTNNYTFITFDDFGYQFSYESFNEFIENLTKNESASFTFFDGLNGYDQIVYDPNTSIISFENGQHSVKNIFNVFLDNYTREQFINEFKIFLKFILGLTESNLFIQKEIELNDQLKKLNF